MGSPFYVNSSGDPIVKKVGRKIKIILTYSKQGKSTIIIVRKIPFAIFITIGTMIFLIMEVMALWHII